MNISNKVQNSIFCKKELIIISLHFQVGGNIFGLRESRSAAIQGPPVPSETNVLVDGTLIDLCGATLLWRSAEGTGSTVWKFQDFSVTQILREINFGDFRSAKYAILTHLEALNFDS